MPTIARQRNPFIIRTWPRDEYAAGVVDPDFDDVSVDLRFLADAIAHGGSVLHPDGYSNDLDTTPLHGPVRARVVKRQPPYKLVRDPMRVRVRRPTPAVFWYGDAEWFRPVKAGRAVQAGNYVFVLESDLDELSNDQRAFLVETGRHNGVVRFVRS